MAVVVVTDESDETGNHGAGETSRIGWRWGGGEVCTAAGTRRKQAGNREILKRTAMR